MATKWYHKNQMTVWGLVIAASIALGGFIFMSPWLIPWIPDRYRLWMGIFVYGIFSYANYKIIALRKLDRIKAAKESENRAARRQADRLKNK